MDLSDTQPAHFLPVFLLIHSDDSPASVPVLAISDQSEKSIHDAFLLAFGSTFTYIQDTAPAGASTNYPAVECTNPVPLISLSSNWSQLHKLVDSMSGDGTTNVTIGLVWGLHALTRSAPLAEASAPASDLHKILSF